MGRGMDLIDLAEDGGGGGEQTVVNTVLNLRGA
jgi:hypothetical protein